MNRHGRSLEGLGASATAATAVNIGTAGHTWTLDGTTPTLNLDGLVGTKGLSYNILPNLTLNQNLTVQGAGTAGFTLSGNITGSSSYTLTKSGASTLTLGGNSSFSGNVTISAGNLKITQSTALGTGTKTVTVSGSSVNLYLDGSAGNISLASGIGIYNSGNALYGIHNVAGNNTINGLYNVPTGSGNGLVSSDGGTLTLAGTVETLNSGGHGINFSGTSTGANTVSGQIINQNGTMSVTKQGGGTWILSNNNNTYTGTTTVSAGTLLVNGSLAAGSAVTVASGATLGGNGTINGTVTVSAGGCLAPGGINTIGTLTLANNSASSLTLNGNQLYFDLPASGTTCDLLTISGASGAMVLNGANYIQLTAPSGAATGTYTLMTYATQTGSGTLTFPNGSTTMTVGSSTLTLNVTAGGSGAGSGSVTLTIGGAAVTALNSDIWSGASSYAWDTSSANWTKNGTASSAFSAGDAATFDDTGLAASPITGSGSPSSVIFNNSVNNYTVSATIGGTGTPLFKNGSGTTILSGANTFSGGLTVYGGTVSFASDGTSGGQPLGAYPGSTAAANVTLNGGTLLDTTTATISANRGITLGASGGTLDASASQTLTVSSSITGSGGLTKGSSTGALTLSGANNYSGLTILSGGKLNLNSTTAINGGGGLTISGGTATLDNTSGGSLTLANVGTVSLPANFTFGSASGSSDLNLNGNTSLAPVGTGITIAMAGPASLYLGNVANNTGNHPTVVNIQGSANGTIYMTSLTLSKSGDAAGRGVTFGNSSSYIGKVNITGTVSDGAGGAATLTAGYGTVTLGGANTHTGGTTLSSATLNINNAQALGTTAGTFTINGGTINNTSGGSITTQNYPQAWNGDFAFTGSNPLDLGAGAVTLGGNRIVTVNGSTLSVDGPISGGFYINKKGNGALTLSGASSYSGGTTLTAGQLNINNGGDATHSAIGMGTLTITAGTIDNTSGSDVALTPAIAQAWNGSFTYAGSANNLNLGSGAVTLGASDTVTVSANTLTVGGAIGGAYNLTKAGSGTLALANSANTYSGVTVFSSGIVNVASLGVYGANSSLGKRLLSAETTAADSATGGIGLHFTGGTLQYTGSGAQTTDRYIRVKNGNSCTIDASGATSADTVTFSQSAAPINFWDTAGSRSVTLIGANTGNNIFALNIPDQAAAAKTSLIKNGNGTWDVTNPHNSDAANYTSGNYGGYTGGTTISGGTLGFASGALGASGTIEFTGSATLHWDSGNTQDLSSRLKIDDGITATIDTGANSVPFATALTLGTSSSGALTKQGSGTLTLSAVNGYSGATTVSAGTLLGGVGGSCVSSDVTVNNTAGCILGVSITDNTKSWSCKSVTFAGANAGLEFAFSGTTAPGSTAPLVVSGAANFTGTPTVNITGVNLPAGDYPLMTWGSYAGTLPTTAVMPSSRQTGTLSLSSDTKTLMLHIGTTLPLTWQPGTGTWDTGAGEWKDNGGNATTYQDGTPGDSVVFDDTPGAGAYTVTLGNTYQPAAVTVNNNNANYTISGSGSIGSSSTALTKSGTGSLTLATANSYAGGTFVNGGTLALSGSGTLGTGGALTLGGGALDLGTLTSPTVGAVSITAAATSGDTIKNGSLTGTAYSASLSTGNATVSASLLASGSAGLTKAGSGTLTLSGANTYTGGTTISAGTLTLSGANTYGTGGITVGTNAAGNVANAVLNVNGSANITTSGSIQVGKTNGANGAINLSAGALTATAADSETGFTFGYGNNVGYGYLGVSGGILNSGNSTTDSRLQFGGDYNSYSTGTGVGLISGGTVNVTRYIIIGRIAGSYGSLTLSGNGTLNHLKNSGAATANISLVHSGGRGELNILGGTLNSAGTSIAVRQSTSGTLAAGTGIVNLNGGTITVNGFANNTGTSPGSAYLNFNGGTLKAGAASTTFIPSQMTAVNVYSGGATIDDGGNAITAVAPLVAPGNTGVTGISMTVGTGVNKGSGYIGAPYVSITGGTLAASGSPATAIANMVDDGTGNGTYKVDSITITGPGVYTDASTLAVSFIGGGGSGAVAGTISTAANTSGGLTKLGIGGLTLSAASTYTGNTTISMGTLALKGTGSINNSANVVVSSGATFDISAVTGGYSLPSGKTLTGKGAVHGAAGIAGTLAPGADNSTLGALTFDNALTLSGTANFRLNKSGATLTNDQVAGATSITAGGTLNVTASGDTLASGDSFTLLNTGTGSSWFSSVSLPALPTGLTWDTNHLATAGYLDVYGFTTNAIQTMVALKNTATTLQISKLTAKTSNARGTVAVNSVSSSSGATVGISGGNITYTPPSGFTGTDTFNAVLSDGHGSITATVYVTVSAANTGPSITPANNGSGYGTFTASGIPGTTYTVQVSTDLSNWTDYATVTADSQDGLIQFTDTALISSYGSAVFYRLKQQ